MRKTTKKKPPETRAVRRQGHIVTIRVGESVTLYTYIRFEKESAILVNLDNGTPYRCSPVGCDCPDATHRKHLCKHSLALAALEQQKRVGSFS